MKKVVLYFLIFVLQVSCFKVVAQEKDDLSSSLMLLYSPLDASVKVLSETSSIGKNHVGYAYAELTRLGDGGAEAYGQFFWEQKFWDNPIFIHAEYRGVVAASFYESSAYLGAAYCIYSKHGYLALEPFAMWKQRLGFGAQFSVVGGWEWKRFILEHYTDLWKTHKMDAPIDIYSQTRCFVKVYKRLSLGVIGTIYYSPDNVASGGAYLALRWKL